MESMSVVHDVGCPGKLQVIVVVDGRKRSTAAEWEETVGVYMVVWELVNGCGE